MSKVNLGELIARAAVSDSDTGREQLEYIDLECIDPDPDNFYSLEGLEELAANIQLCGLQQPLRVRTGESGHVVVVSGHRRRAALALLAREDAKWRSVPCLREKEEGSAALRELKLIYANSDTRQLTSAELARQAQRVEELLYRLKEEGYDFPGRMRDHVAQACKVSAPKLARLKVIRESLTGKWAELFQSDQLSEQAAYAIARMPEELQGRLSKACPEPPMGYAAERILFLWGTGSTWQPDMTCPDGRECKRGDAFLRHDVEHCHNPCKGETCCLDCQRAKDAYYSCDRMCAKAQTLRKEKQDRDEALEEKRKARQQKVYQKSVQENAARLLRAAEAAGLDDSQTFSPNIYRPEVSVGELRSYAAGDFMGRTFFGDDLNPVKFNRLDKLAQLFQCSSDYLLGLTDELQMPGRARDETSRGLDGFDAEEAPFRRIHWEVRGRTPPEGRLLLTYHLTNAGPEYRTAEWDGNRFVSPGHGKELTGLRYTHWLELPQPGSGESVSWCDGETDGAPQYVSGETPPPRDGMYYCRFDCEGTVITQAVWWDSVLKSWHFGNGGARIDARCLGWYPLPD